MLSILALKRSMLAFTHILATLDLYQYGESIQQFIIKVKTTDMHLNIQLYWLNLGEIDQHIFMKLLTEILNVILLILKANLIDEIA